MNKETFQIIEERLESILALAKEIKRNHAADIIAVKAQEALVKLDAIFPPQ